MLSAFDLERFVPLEDVAYAHWISQDSQVQALALWLRLALKVGHTALQETSHGLFPKISDLLTADAVEKIPQESITSLEHLAMQAFVNRKGPYIRQNNFLQLPFMDACERRCLAQVRRLSVPANTSIMPDFVDGRLNAKQREVVQKALSENFVLVAGGPGTGKTYTVGRFLALYSGLQDTKGLKVILAAPTGKAAVQLKKSLEQAFAGSIPFVYEIKTLHALTQSKVSIDAHVVIVDECSMIDMRLLESFLQLVPQGTKLIMLGDPNQLPPVGAGAPFSTLVQAAAIEKVELSVCHRTETAELEALAFSLRSQSHDFFSLLQRNREHDQGAVGWYSLDEASLRKRLSDKGQGAPLILTPKRHGSFGVMQLNELAKNYFSNMPLIVTQNDWKLGVTNGEVGEKIVKMSFGRKRDYFRSGEREIPLALLPSFEPAYALSVHKSQGSEADRVMIVLPEGSELFGWKLLYTAITRAKKRVEIFASLETLTKVFDARQDGCSAFADKFHD